MPHMTIADYALLNHITRQAVEDRIERGTLGAVVRDIKVKRKMVIVNTEEIDALARLQAEG